MTDRISPEDLNTVRLLQQETQIAKLNSEKTELKAHNFTLELYLKYGLTSEDSISIENGSIQRKAQETPTKTATEDNS